MRIKKFVLPAVAALALLFAYLPAAHAQSGSIGCGTTGLVACNGESLPGTVTDNTEGTLYSSGGMDVYLTAVSGLSSKVSGLQVFQTDADQFDFSFAGVGLTFDDGGTFTFTDLSEPGALTVTGTAELSGTPTGSLTGPLGLVLDATHYDFGGLMGTLNASGYANLNLDPGTITSMDGEVGLPATSSGPGPGPTPEPASLLLLGTGLLGMVPFLRRRF